ncbi:phosphate transport system permease protein PstA [Spirochaetota bacterium]|nr:phosphate transport system permease protein PstA [Spirochaetota bacterium]
MFALQRNATRYRIIKNHIFNGIVLFFTVLALVPLFLIVYHVVKMGIPAIDWDFLTTTEAPPDTEGGGIVNSIVGTVAITFLATFIATPFAIAAGTYIAFNRKKKLSEWVYLSCSALQSIPAIVVGLIIYIWIVAPMGRFSILAGSVACAFMMFPIIIISTVEVISLISNEVIEAAFAMGASFFKTIMKVVLPIATPGIAAGIIIALARVTGEAAPILFTAFGNPFIPTTVTDPASTLPLTIYKFAISPYENWQETAWGASFILLLFIIVVNFTTKLLTKKR